MSGRPAVTWGMIEAACRARGISIEYGKGSERKLVGAAPDGRIRVQIIGHHWCKSRKTPVSRQVVAAFKRNFGVSDEELVGE